MKTKSKENSDCCPQFDPAPWEDKLHQWDGKKFMVDSVFTCFYMPVNFGSVMKKLDRKATASGARIVDNLCLADHTSKWNMDVYVAVDKDIEGIKTATLRGQFYSKVYEGPYKDTAKWCKDFENSAKLKGLNITKWYMWYTTCPKCAKKNGKNYVVIISQVG